MTTFPSERQKQIMGYVEDVLRLSKAPKELLIDESAGAAFEARKPKYGREGEVQIVVRFKDRTEYWAMTFCDCHDQHDGWRLDLVVGVN